MVASLRADNHFLYFILRLIGENLLECSVQHFVHCSILVIAKMHVVDTYKRTLRIAQIALYLLWRGHTHREVSTWLTTVDDALLEIHIVKIEVLIEIFCRASGCHRANNLVAYLIIECLNLTLEHRSADVLRSQKQQTRL